jgi:LemA protein
MGVKDIIAGIGIVGVVIVGIIVLLLLMVAGTYNSLVNKDTTVEQKWGNVQTAYQRRADLIPNLVETVKGAKNFEQQTQTQIAELRSQAGQAKVNVQNAQDAEQLQAVGSQMDSVLSRLLVIVENYPDLKSNQNFLSLQDQLEGTENRVKYDRDEYNAAVKDYKQSVRSFPTNIMAGMFGFNVDKWKMFQAAAGAETAPAVNFT